MECKLNNVTINYEVYGEGRPMLLVHGFTPDHRLMTGCMEPVFQKYDGWKRYYIDLPGMGQTKAPEWLKNSDQMLDIVLEFIDTVLPGQRVTLAGESYGGYISRGIINKRPGIVDGLLLICPCIIADDAKRTRPEKAILAKDEKLMASLSREDYEAFDGIAVVQSQRHWERFRNEIMSGLLIADEKFLSKFRQECYSYSFDVDKLPAPFTGPSLILTGRQDNVVGYHDAYKILENYPRAAFAILDMAGHDMQIEQEELFNALVSEWLNRMEM